MDFQARIDELGEKLKKEAHEFNKERVKQQEEAAPAASPVDFYDLQRVKMNKEAEKAYPRGASTLVKRIADEALRDLSRSHKEAEVKSEYWEERGDKEKAQMEKDQYMQERFLPAVEMVIIASTPDEVLNAKDILSEFDKLSFEYGPGYTASYIRTAYGDQLGNASNQSDGYVRDAIERIKFLAGDGQIRTAYGLAKRTKDEIDNGRHTSNEVDYDLLTRIVTMVD